MPLTKLQFKPGINRETTSYSNEGGWFDMDKVRFRFGFPEKIGGWIKNSNVALDGSQYVGVGTHLKYYILEGGIFNDITPIRSTTAGGDVTFAAGANALNGAINASVESIIIGSVAGFPVSGTIKIGNEQITYAAINSATLTGCARGQNGTTAANHSNGASVTCATLKPRIPDYKNC